MVKEEPLADFYTTFSGTLCRLDIYTLFNNLFAGYDVTTKAGRELAKTDGLLRTDGYHPGETAHTECGPHI
ncbi:MAG: hypothetical protein KKE62_17150 [Proteobacteria bacterium]|nr:hypothetical protein [Pseudomonadota bacterium]MBU1386449.1 hypothetical protein [Pseudomonadota bacterium]MBU1544560.1 hypothetical protein [Pseudomonadota bacterium]MBU2429713.1 hypothetical protein [Pseudomonadota bacterium]MBU2481229.1 hypothetical protein [Pseudomonadota bacterium]